MAYNPDTAPLSVDTNTARWVRDELLKVAVEFEGVENVRLKELHVEPPKPRDGDVILADGTDFNPGSGAGFYGRSAGAWVLLG